MTMHNNYRILHLMSARSRASKFSPTAAALLAALSASPSWAQSTATVYGLVDLGFVRESGGPKGASANKLTSGVQSGSRLGFKGTEDMGGGLGAFYTLEMGPLADTGGLAQGGLGFGRLAVVGLQGVLGSVTLGRQYTPVAIVQTETDPFGTGLAGDSANLISAGGAGGNNRMDNTVRYAYTHSSGFTADVVYGFGEVENHASYKRQYGGAFGYVSGPAYVKIGYHNVNDANGVPGWLTFLGAKYDFGIATAHFNYVVNKGSAVFGIVNADSRDVMVGVAVPYGQGRFLASYIHKDDRTTQNYDANQIAFGYVHFISKRTNFYTSIARIDNNAPAGSKTGFYRVGNATEQGLGSRAYNLGIRHVY
ncbi:porin [Variovorax sp. YR216]|uniref:porin n=1 Tax=Variovorax sp. YR216 TaxID=1882828 RepID=UPI00089A772F|nr:porin [Variovorax sp. YR216]SEB07894.1 Outer membrane protein (porin) [Variovorax sp. YR216]